MATKISAQFPAAQLYARLAIMQQHGNLVVATALLTESTI
jgi:hypothetical protein